MLSAALLQSIFIISSPTIQPSVPLFSLDANFAIYLWLKWVIIPESWNHISWIGLNHIHRNFIRMLLFCTSELNITKNSTSTSVCPLMQHDQWSWWLVLSDQNNHRLLPGCDSIHLVGTRRHWQPERILRFWQLSNKIDKNLDLKKNTYIYVLGCFG